MDERRGRTVARTMGLSVTGSVGILLKAKRQGLLPAVRPAIETMRSHGVWLSDDSQAFAVGGNFLAPPSMSTVRVGVVGYFGTDPPPGTIER